MKFVIVSLMLLNLGCSTLPEKVFTKVKTGDPSTKVASLLGTPTSFQPNRSQPSFDDWEYVEKDQMCIILVKNETVKSTMCGKAR